jgi:phage terminase large subunit-like protein
MSWQQYVADVALEVDRDSGRLAYREIVLTVPRQSGKTALMLAVMVHRALGFGSRQRIVYTAQSRLHARKKWEDEHVVNLQQSRFRSSFSVRKQIGQEAIRWKNGSLHGLDAPTEDAVHGDTLDLGAVDEAFAHEDDRVEQGMRPAMVTRPQPQLWIFSTAGTLKSVYLREKVDAGRLTVEAGLSSPVAYFEWSAPTDADPGDPETWRSCMPALGETVREEAIRADYASWTARGKLPEFTRAYLNWWPNDMPEEWQVIPKAAWEVTRDPASQVDLSRRVAFAADTNRDHTWASIAVAGRRADGDLHVEVTTDEHGQLDHRRGTAWVVPRLRELQDRYRPCAVVLAPSSPISSLIPEAEAAGLEILKPSVAEIAGACGAFYDATGANPEQPASLRHLGQPELTTALAGALRRDLGDRWLWTRKNIAVDLTPLVAVTLAAWGHATRAHVVDEAQPFLAAWR